MASLKSSSPLLLVLVLGVLSYASAEDRRGPRLGGWEPIDNINDPRIQELAVFALTEHNKLGGTNLQFRRIISGEQQVVAGMNYKLVLAAKSGGKDGVYEAVIWEQPWTKTRKLTSFRRV